MNIRSFAFVVGAVGALVVAACGDGGSTGAGGTGGSGGSGAAGGTGGTGGGTGGTGGSTCAHCAASITDPTIDPSTFCAPSKPLFDALAQCTCQGTCMGACMDNACVQMAPSGACSTCVMDKTINGCGAELEDCSADDN